MSQPIREERRDGVLILTIDRMEKRNALSPAMYTTLAGALRQAAVAPDIHAVVLLGQPGGFCAGNEIESFLELGEQGGGHPVFAFMDALAGCPLPVVAAVDGIAVGIGATLLLHCDLVYATPRARLQFGFARLGVCPEFASSLLLQRIVGRANAAEALLVGEPLSAERALQWGLVSELVPETAIVDHACSRAHAIAQLGSDAVRTTKRLMRAAEAADIAAAMEREQPEFLRLLRTDRVQQGFRDHLAQRKAPG